jgi:hypothetical protein
MKLSGPAIDVDPLASELPAIGAGKFQQNSATLPLPFAV